MTNIVQHKRGTSIPTALDLAVGEIGINMTSQKIYTKDTGGTIIELSPSEPAGTTTEVQFRNGTAFGADSTFTFDAGNDRLTVDKIAVSSQANLGANGNITITGTTTAGQTLLSNGSNGLNWGYTDRIANGTSNITIPAVNGNVLISANGLANVATFTSNGTVGNTIISGRVQVTGGAIVQTYFDNGSSAVFDVSKADYFSYAPAATSNPTISFTNAAINGRVSSFIMMISNGGAAGTITWPSTPASSDVLWDGGITPTLTSAGVDVLGFFTHNAGLTWYGLVLAKDAK